MRRSLLTGLSLLALAACQTMDSGSAERDAEVKVPEFESSVEVAAEEVVSETVLVSVPAEYETVTETIIVQPQSVTYEVIPGKFEWVDGEIPGESVEYVEIPAQYETVEETIVVQEASTELVTVPVAYETLADGSRVVKMPASTRERVLPAVTTTETRRVLKTPARVEEVTVSNKIEDGKTFIMVESPRTVEKTIPAITKTISRRVVKTPASTIEVLAPRPVSGRVISGEAGSETVASPTGEILARVMIPATPHAKDEAAESTAKVRPEIPSPPQLQAGSLTAGDYDDVLNPHLYVDYAAGKLVGALAQKDLPRLNTQSAIEVQVYDRLGKPYPMAEIELSNKQGKVVQTLRTGANGKVHFYPDLDQIRTNFVITAEAPNGQRITRKLQQQMVDNGSEIAFDFSADRTPVGKLDLLLTIDATGSMSDEMRYLQAEISGIVGQVAEANPGVNIRTGLIVYRDTNDTYVVKDFPFTEDLEAFRTSLNAQSATGGGDKPEAMDLAFEKGLEFDWREDAIKVNLLVADAPPHNRNLAQSWTYAEQSRAHGIHIVPIAASGVDPTAEYLMRSMALITGGRYLFLTDDSGIGNPHAEPSVDCYVVTHLNGLVTRVVSGLVSGERVEPMGNQVIRTVGNYRGGVCAQNVLEFASNTQP